MYPILHTLVYPACPNPVSKSGGSVPEDRLQYTAEDIYQLSIVITRVTSSKKKHKTWGLFVYIHHVSSLLCTAKAEENIPFYFPTFCI